MWSEGAAHEATPAAGRPGWAEVLRALREAAGVTQAGWAASLGYGRSTIQRWERGELAPDAAAELALLRFCRDKGLFRPYREGILGGQELTPEGLQGLLAEARLGVSTTTAAPSTASRSPATGTPASVGARVGDATAEPGAASELPTGTVTLMFTDIEGSTWLQQHLGARYAEAQAEHRALLRRVFTDHGGVEVDTQGDAFFVAFTRPAAAIAAAHAAQRALAAHQWPAGGAVRVRMGLHTGAPQRTSEGYVGLDVVRAARICAAGHGGQVLVSAALAGLLELDLPADVTLRDLGQHRLKDLSRPEQVYQAVFAGLPADFPPLRSLAAHAHNLPVAATALVGRGFELTALQSLLRQHAVRLLTVTGAGGTGKTTLAVQVAAGVVDAYPHGVVMVHLAPLTDPALVASTIAQTLGLREDAGAGAGSLPSGEPSSIRVDHQRLVDYLQDKRLLLVLDNFEHLLPAAALVANLLARCQHLAVLVTSRAALRVRGEREFPLPPLTVPSTSDLPPLSDLGQVPAVQLFVQRARDVRPDFTLTAATAGAVAAICVRLDGLPLALELAAARMRVLTPAELLARLELKVLAGGGPDLPERQQTLRDTMAWSYDLLTPGEQLLFRRLAVFASGCTLTDAEAVCNRMQDLPLDVLDGLSSLVDKSLLRMQPPADADSAGGAGRSRFRMLETMREYAAELLEESGEGPEIRLTLLKHLRRMGEQAVVGLDGAEQFTWLTRLEAELGNIRAALSFSLSDPSLARDGLFLAAALLAFWWENHLQEGRTWLIRLLANGAGAGTHARAVALYAAAQLELYVGGYAAAYPLLNECAALSRSLGFAPMLARALGMLGWVLALRGEDAQAQTAIEDSVKLARQVDDAALVAEELMWHGLASFWLGDVVQAQSSWAEGLELERGRGDHWRSAAYIGRLGDAAYVQGDYPAARRLCEESAALWRRAGSGAGAAQSLATLGRVALAEGHVEQAMQTFHESLTIAREMGSRIEIPLALSGLAAAFSVRGEAERAVRLFGAAKALAEDVGVPLGSLFRDEHTGTLATLRERLGEAAFTRAWEHGGTLTVDQAARLALDEAIDD